MTSTIELKIIVATEDDLRRIIREEIEAWAEVEAQTDTVTFHPLSGGPARELKLRMPPQDGGQALEP